jgi:hypothetical protein
VARQRRLRSLLSEAEPTSGSEASRRISQHAVDPNATPGQIRVHRNGESADAKTHFTGREPQAMSEVQGMDKQERDQMSAVPFNPAATGMEDGSVCCLPNWPGRRVLLLM